MLFDLGTDPDEFDDLGADPDSAGELARLYGLLNAWARRQSQRVTRSADDLQGMRGRSARRGIVLGAYDESDVPPNLISKYMGPAEVDRTREG